MWQYTAGCHALLAELCCCMKFSHALGRSIKRIRRYHAIEHFIQPKCPLTTFDTQLGCKTRGVGGEGYLWVDQDLFEWECPDQLVWVLHLPAHPFLYSEPPCKFNELVKDGFPRYRSGMPLQAVLCKKAATARQSSGYCCVYFGDLTGICAQHCKQHSQTAAWLNNQNMEPVMLHASDHATSNLCQGSLKFVQPCIKRAECCADL